MLSIIISSHNPIFFDALQANIEKTIGSIDYEIIKIENQRKMSLCTAYNKGAGQAKFSNLLFIHEDILFHTENWGAILVDNLSDPLTGVIGLVGSNYVPKAPSSWYITGLKDFEQKTEGKKEAIMLDGVFLAIRSDAYNKVKFSEEIPGFHGYDTDFCLKSAKYYQNYITSDIKIEHFSGGNPDKQHLDNNILIRKLRGYNFNHKKNRTLEANAFISFINSYISHYNVNYNSITSTFKHFPFRVGLKNNMRIIKTYLQILKYSKDYNK